MRTDGIVYAIDESDLHCRMRRYAERVMLWRDCVTVEPVTVLRIAQLGELPLLLAWYTADNCAEVWPYCTVQPGDAAWLVTPPDDIAVIVPARFGDDSDDAAIRRLTA